MSTVIINLVEADANKRSYGITHRSEFVYRVKGRIHNPTFPHRVQVWDNTDRPNPRNGEPVRYGSFGKLDGGNGQYLDPNHEATDAERTYILSAEPIAITNSGMNTGTKASGQVFGDEVLEIGQFVVLRYPDGTLSNPFYVAARPLRDPELSPVS